MKGSDELVIKSTEPKKLYHLLCRWHHHIYTFMHHQAITLTKLSHPFFLLIYLKFTWIKTNQLKVAMIQVEFYS